MPRRKGMRCSGFMSDDGRYAHCGREERAGGIQANGAGLYAHYLAGPCNCGTSHATASTPSLAGNGPSPRVVKETTYPLRDITGKLVAEHIRRDRVDGTKTFSWRVPGHEKEGLHGLRKDALPLFGTESLAKADSALPVVVCEGEKAADTLRKLGVVAVGTVTGAPNPPKSGQVWPVSCPSTEILKVLSGRMVYLWPDHDPQGNRHMHQVAERLLEASHIINWAGARDPGDDAADFVTRGGTLEELRKLISDAKPWGGPVELEMKPAVADPPSSAPAAEVVRLAALPTIEYEKERKAAARKLGVRAGALDREVWETRARAGGDGSQGTALNCSNPEPWPEAVDGAAVLEEIAVELRRYVTLPAHAGEAIALWCVAAHVLAADREAFDISPRLIFTSPTPRCGKTLALSLVELLCPRALNTANVTSAAIFRVIDMARPTLVIDEADALFAGEAEELRGLLNAGHRVSSRAIRVVGEKHEVRAFDVFGPVALAAIGRLPGTLEDRAVMIQMRRRAPGERVEHFVRRKAEPRLAEIMRRVFRWVKDRLAEIKAREPETPETLDDRAADNWRPLMAVADAAGGAWPGRAREAALALSASRDDGESIKVRLLADIQKVFRLEGSDRMASADLAERLAAVEDAPWGEWGRREKPITKNQLAGLLKAFDVTTRATRFPDGKTLKGYHLEDFGDAFARYLPGNETLQRYKPLVRGPNGKKTANDETSQDAGVTNQKLASRSPTSPPNTVCNAVTFRSGGTGEEEGEYARREREAIQEEDKL